MKLVRTIQKINIDTNNSGRILVPNELGLKPEDVILFEIIDEKTFKMTKIA